MLCVFLFLFTLASIGLIPTIKELMVFLIAFFKSYGLIAVMLCSFIENIAGLNIYFPGSIVILSAMALSAGNPKQAILLFFIITIFSIFAHIINYYSAKKIKHLNIRNQDPPGLSEFLLSFWHPHFAAIVCVKCGWSDTPANLFLKRMISVAILWYIFWAIMMYYLGSLTVTKNPNRLIYVFCIYFILWGIWDIYTYKKEKLK